MHIGPERFTLAAMRLFFPALILFLAIMPTPLRAGEPLIFRDHISGPREREFLKTLELSGAHDAALPYSIASIDLNGDGVEEWIFRQGPPSCRANADCRIVIGGISEGEAISLGQMRGGKIGVADEKLYGVRKLLVYNEKSNDFIFQTYVWTPDKQAFAPE